MSRFFSFSVPVLLLAAAAAFPDTVREMPFQPFYAESAAQGGSRVATASGYDALFSNPAGFANGKGGFTLGSFSLWMLARPDRVPGLLDLMRTRDGSDSGEAEVLAAQAESDGFGLGTALGIGFVGGGLGIGFQAGYDSYFYGSSFPDNLQGVLLSEFSFVVGYALTFHLPGIKLLLGADIRPHIRVHSLFDSAASAALAHDFFGVATSYDDVDPYGATWALNGSGIAVDAGLIASAGPFSLGVSARDVFDTQIRYSWNSLKSVKSSLLGGGLPPAFPVPGDADYFVPMSVSAGLSFHPDLGKFSRILDPRLHGEISDVFGALDPPGTEPAFSERLRLGAEIRLLSRLSLRGGLNGGLPAFGAGLRLFIFDFNFAVFGTRTGPDGREVPGASLDFAIRL